MTWDFDKLREFKKAWDGSKSVREVAEKMKCSCAMARVIACKLRRKGIALDRMGWNRISPSDFGC